MITNFLLTLLILTLPFGQLTRVTLFSPEIHFYLQDIIILLLIFFSLIEKKIPGEIFKKELNRTIFAFFLLGGFSLFLSLNRFPFSEILISSLYLFRWLAYAFVFLLTPIILKSSGKANFYKLLIYQGLALAIFGLIQYFLFPDFRAFEIYGWDPHYYRLLSTLFDPGFTALMLVLSLILLVVHYWNYFLGKKPLVFYFVFLIFYLALALTYSRSGYLAYLLAFLLITLKKHKFHLFPVILILGVITVLLLPRPGGEGVKLERTASIEARFENWQEGLLILKDNPLFGAGFNTLRYVQRNYGFSGDKWQESHASAGLDASFLFILATSGIAGFLTFTHLLRLLFHRQSLIINASLIALISHSFFNNTLFYPWIMLWFWLVFSQEVKDNRRL